MSAFKRISVSDSFVVPYTANKSWDVSFNDFNNYQITINKGTKTTGTFSPNEATSSKQYNRLIYNAVNTSYYPDFLPKYINTSSMYGTIFNDGTLSTSSYYNGFVNLGNLNTIKYFPTNSGNIIYTVNIPRQLAGDKILPSTFNLALFTSSVNYEIYDDGNYNLRYSGSNVSSSINTVLSQSSYVGNIFYEQNIAVLTIIPNPLTGSLDTDITNISFQNNHVVYENFAKCTIKDYEYNASYNPTLLSGSQGVLTPYSSSNTSDKVYVTPSDSYGILKDFATGSISGSEFSPYVTTVGLYNDAQDLLAVAKMSTPIPISSNTDMTFLVKWDTNFISKFAPQSYVLGQYLLGGYIIYIDSTGQHGLIAPDFDDVEQIFDRNWEQAFLYCDAFVVNGYSDWRLGTLQEMRFIDVNQVYIPNFVIDLQLWTSTEFDIDLSYGIIMDGTGLSYGLSNKLSGLLVLPIKSF